MPQQYAAAVPEQPPPRLAPPPSHLQALVPATAAVVASTEAEVVPTVMARVEPPEEAVINVTVTVDSIPNAEVVGPNSEVVDAISHALAEAVEGVDDEEHEEANVDGPWMDSILGSAD